MDKIKIVIEKTNTGYSAYAEGLGVGTTGDNRAEIKYNILEALNLYYEDEGRVITEDDICLTFALGDRMGMSRSLLSQ